MNTTEEETRLDHILPSNIIQADRKKWEEMSKVQMMRWRGYKEQTEGKQAGGCTNEQSDK